MIFVCQYNKHFIVGQDKDHTWSCCV